jgi:hypothetical protein
MGFAKSLATGILSFIVFTTLPFAITSYFFIQEFNMPNMTVNIGGFVISSILQETGFYEQFASQFGEIFPALQAACTLDPSLNLAYLFEAMLNQSGGIEGGEFVGMLLPCIDIPCATVLNSTSDDIVNMISAQLETCDIQIPKEFLMQMGNMTMPGMNFDLSGLLGTLDTFMIQAQIFIIYAIIIGILCSIMLLAISRDAGYFSKRMGAIFLITGIGFIIFTYVLKVVLPNILLTTFANIGTLLMPIITALVIDPFDRLLPINFLYCFFGALGIAIGMILKRHKGSTQEEKELKSVK